MKLSLVFLALGVFTAGMVPALASAESQGQITFSGSVTSNGTLYLQTRDGGGVPLSAAGPIPLSSGQSATVVRNNTEGYWTIIYLCIIWDFFDLIIYEAVPFTVWASTDGSSWSQITNGSPFSTNGITIRITSNPTSIVPTLAEWGLILLAGTILGTGVWMLRRGSRQPKTA